MTTAEELAKELRNIGPIVARKLIKAGINTPAKLKKIGAKKAFLRIFQTGGFCGKFHAAYLYALEGAIQDCDWRALSEKKNKGFKAFTAELRKMSIDDKTLKELVNTAYCLTKKSTPNGIVAS